MVNVRGAVRGIALLALLGGGAVLHAQHISSLQSAPFQGSSCVSTSPYPAGAAITASSPSAANGICLYVNGTFAGETEYTVNWTGSDSVVHPLSQLTSTSSQIIAFAPASYFATAQTVAIAVTVIGGGSSNMVSFTVDPPLTNASLTSTALPYGVVGVPYSNPFFAGGTAPYTVSFVNSPPPGLTYTPLGGNPLTGTPTTAGPYPVSGFITDTWGNTFTTTETLTIYGVLSITTASLPNARVNTAYSTTVAAAGGATTYHWSATGLPSGLSINVNTGVIAGTTALSGIFTVVVTVTDQSGQTANASYSLDVVPTLVVTTTSLPAGTAGTAYTATLAATGGFGSYTWSAAGLPSGLNIGPATGVISGSTTQYGNFTINVTLNDQSSQTATASLLLIVYTAQVSNPPTCAVSSSTVTPTVRSEGLTELVSDILITCSGGLPVASGSPLPQLTITVFLNSAVTSRLLSSAGASEALLLVDEPGSFLTGAPFNPLSCGPITSCSIIANGAEPYDGSAGHPNVFQGSSIGNGLTFSVPYSNPGNYGVGAVPNNRRILRITNLRVNASGIAINGQVGASLAFGGPSLSVSPTAATLANVNQGLVYQTRNAANSATVSSINLNACSAGSYCGAATLAYQENFATAFKTRVQGNGQNIPGAVYNTESGFYNPGLAASNPTLGTAGLADFGTRLKADFSGIPAGAQVWVGLQPSIGNAGATLTATEAGAFSAVPQSGAINDIPAAQLTVANGQATAVWEITSANAGVIDTADFPVWVLFPVGAIPSGTLTVRGSFGPNSNDGAFPGNAGQGAQTSTFPIPRFYSALSILTSSLPGGSINTPYSAALAATADGVAPYTWSATGLPAGLSINAATGVISGTPAINGIFTVNVTVADSTSRTATAALPLTILPLTSGSSLAILSGGFPTGYVNVLYGTTLIATGGTPAYTWSASGLPSTLSLNASTGAIFGTPTQVGNYAVTVRVTDSSSQTAQVVLGLTIASSTLPSLPVIQVTGTGPNATVGLFYASTLSASGGSGGPYTFSAAGGLPPGLQVATNGQIQGTPSAPGTFTFSVTATDANGNSGSSAISITVMPAPLAITTGILASVAVGSSFGVTFSATGGVFPYTFALSGAAPPGASLSSGGVLSGTATTVGTYGFTVTVTDSARNTVSKGFSITVTPGPLVISAMLPSGQAGAAYAGQFTAAGGTPPYTWSGSAGGGLTVSSTGAVSGTPTAAGTFPVSVTVMDAGGMRATGSYSILIGVSSLTITTTSLPNGALTSAYSGTLNATGGTPAYTFTATGLPPGITLSAAGTLGGTPTSPGTFSVSVTVTDSARLAATATLSITVLPAPVKITTTGISPATLGTSFSLAFGATGGTAPYTWTATGLPAGVTLTSTGTLSGTPTALGSTPITVTVTDVNALTASETITLTVVLPTAPTVALNGLPATASPATQSTTPVTFNAAFPVDVTVNLTLTFTPLSGADDPNIQFSTGGRTATVTVKAGATTSTSTIGVQTGTVAGTITITTQLVAAGQNITPVPAPTKTIVIGPAAPTVTSVTGSATGTGFTVTIDGFDPTRAVTQVVLTFAPAAGSSLQTSTITISAASLFSTWYQSSAAAAYGSQFSFTIPFTVTGSVQSIASFTVTLTNPTGTSAGGNGAFLR